MLSSPQWSGRIFQFLHGNLFEHRRTWYLLKVTNHWLRCSLLYLIIDILCVHFTTARMKGLKLPLEKFYINVFFFSGIILLYLHCNCNFLMHSYFLVSVKNKKHFNCMYEKVAVQVSIPYYCNLYEWLYCDNKLYTTVLQVYERMNWTLRAIFSSW